MVDKVTSNPKIQRRAQTNHIRRQLRTLAPPLLTERQTLCERAVRWILPWTVRNYPGVRRGLVQLFGYHVTYSAIKGWRTGRRNMPADHVDHFAHFVRSHAERGLALAAELEQWAQRRRREETERREAKRRRLNAVRWRC